MFETIKFIFRILFPAAVVTLLIRSIRDYYDYVPFSFRRFIFAQSMWSPLSLTRLLLNLFTRPIGDESEWIQKIKQDTWKGAWIAPHLKNVQKAEHRAMNSDLVILYIHGGGFSVGHSSMYMPTFQLIIKHLDEEHQIQATIMSLNYSLSPENVWPKACDESIDAYRYLISLGIDPSKIIMAGDSAGGNLVATTLLNIRNQRDNNGETPLPLPIGAALLSPWIDLGPNSFDSSQRQDLLNPHHISTFTSYYLDDKSKTTMIHNSSVSPIYGDFSEMCPLFVAYGDNELLKTSIEKFISNLRRDGCDISTLRGENQSHIWLVHSFMARSKQAYERDCKSFVNWMACKIGSNYVK